MKKNSALRVVQSEPIEDGKTSKLPQSAMLADRPWRSDQDVLDFVRALSADVVNDRISHTKAAVAFSGIRLSARINELRYKYGIAQPKTGGHLLVEQSLETAGIKKHG
jgi:hypothetical protein